MNVTSTWSKERITHLWSEVFGAGFELSPWVKSVEWIEGSWDRPGVVEVGLDAPDDVGIKQATITPADLIAALDGAVRARMVDTCTGNPIHEHMEWDACSSDVLIQIAVLGDVYYS